MQNFESKASFEYAHGESVLVIYVISAVTSRPVYFSLSRLNSRNVMCSPTLNTRSSARRSSWVFWLEITCSKNSGQDLSSWVFVEILCMHTLYQKFLIIRRGTKCSNWNVVVYLHEMKIFLAGRRRRGCSNCVWGKEWYDSVYSNSYK